MKKLIVIISVILSGSTAWCNIFNFTDDPFLARGDGTTDNREALIRAFKELNPGDTLYIPSGDYRVVLTQGSLTIPAGITVLGAGAKSRFLLDSSAGENEHREFLRFSDNVTLEGITTIRNASFPAVLFPLFGEFANLTIRNCTIDGNKERFPAKYCHAIQVGVGTVSNVTIEHTRVTNCSYGLFQASKSSGSFTHAVVQNCVFERNTSSDLEFNAPHGKMSDIIVRDCFFKDNLCKSASAGFAVGFANVKKSRVENCTIHNYGSEVLHVEDRSENIQLSGNTIVNGSTDRSNGIIMILSGSKSVEIDSNFIDGRCNTNKVHLVLVTGGGNSFACPKDVMVKNNVLINGPLTRTWYLQPGSGTEPEKNVVVESEKMRNTR